MDRHTIRVGKCTIPVPKMDTTRVSIPVVSAHVDDILIDTNDTLEEHREHVTKTRGYCAEIPANQETE